MNHSMLSTSINLCIVFAKTIFILDITNNSPVVFVMFQKLVHEVHCWHNCNPIASDLSGGDKHHVEWLLTEMFFVCQTETADLTTTCWNAHVFDLCKSRVGGFQLIHKIVDFIQRPVAVELEAPKWPGKFLLYSHYVHNWKNFSLFRDQRWRC